MIFLVLIEASVWVLSSVPCLCLTSLGSVGWINPNHVSTTRFSSVGGQLLVFFDYFTMVHHAVVSE